MVIDLVIDVLACPACRGPLREGRSGELLCAACRRVSARRIDPASDRVFSFLDGSAVDAGFDHRWRAHPRPQASTAGVFEEKTGFGGELAGQLVLDAGCGIGRFSAVAAALGARVVGVDGSPAAVVAAARQNQDGLFLHADLRSLPVRDGVLDAAFSIGVLHHLADPEAGFRELARATRPGGRVAVWVYADVHGHERTRAAADFLHEVTRACPPAALHAACERHAVRLRDLYAGAWGPLERVLQVSTSTDDEECVSDTFDWHCPQHRSWHTLEEVRGWFERAGLAVDRVGDFPVSVRGVRVR